MSDFDIEKYEFSDDILAEISCGERLILTDEKSGDSLTVNEQDVAAMAKYFNLKNEYCLKIEQLELCIKNGREYYQLMLDKIIKHGLYDELVKEQVDKYNGIFIDMPIGEDFDNEN